MNLPPYRGGVSRRLWTLAAALVATGAVVTLGVGLGVGDDESDQPAAPPAAAPTVPSIPLTDYDTSTVAIERAAFCDAVPPEAVERALGAAPSEETTYDDGQPARLTRGVRDVAHEYGCEWSSGATTVRAWLFAPPVTSREAGALVDAAGRTDGCRAAPGAQEYGSPSVGLVCEAEPGLEASYRGLFGDAWLACSVAGVMERDAAADRAGRWCVAVAQAASAG